MYSDLYKHTKAILSLSIFQNKGKKVNFNGSFSEMFHLELSLFLD